MGAGSKLFLDTSALLAGIWSREGGARMLLKLGEAGAVQLLISTLVVTEIERTLREKAPEALGALAVLLDRSNVTVVPAAPPGVLKTVQKLITHAGDAQVLAAAWAGGVDYLVTLDCKHFLENRRLQSRIPFPMGTPGDCLAWLRTSLPATRP